MGSPQIESFYVINPTTRAPVTGIAGSMSFVTYQDETGSPLTPPTIIESGGGWYYFTPTFASPSHGIQYVLNIGSASSVTPDRIGRYVRAEDWYTDEIQDLHDVEVGSWQIFKTGPNANQMWLYRPDSSVLKKFALYDDTGAPTSTNVFLRVPI